MSKMKFKVGDRVMLNPNKTDFKYERAGVEYDEIGEIERIRDGKKIDVKFPSHSCWTGLKDELILANEFEVGDTVRIRKNCTLKDLTLNYWNGCQASTMRFLTGESERTDFDDEYVVETVHEKWLEVRGFKYPINKTVFQIVNKKETVKEMTLKEVCDALGYEVKIIKEED